MSVVVGAAVGVGAWLLAFGLLPTFRPVDVGDAGREVTTERDDVLMIRAVMLDPHVLAEKRRLTTAAGIGCVVGAATTLAVFVRARRWC